MRYEERIIEDVRGANDIIDIISQHVPLKRAGQNFKGLCPFHDEKTPSFTVHPGKQIFHCFGCGLGGDVFRFLMQFENLSFPEAMKSLAERAHIALPAPTAGPESGPSETQRFYEVYRLAAEYYHAQLLSPDAGRTARAYLKKRGLGETLIKEFQIGWAQEAWRGLFDFLSKKGFSEKILLQASLIKRSPKGNVYDVFRGRVLFPIHNLQGKVVGFGGRVLAAGEGPKYLNSPENPIFRKRRELFGLHFAKRFIDRTHPQILVVEGYLDFLSLYQAGFKSAAATLGTALTPEHVQVLKRFADEAVVIYDGDEAGLQASLKGLETFIEGDMNVKLVRMPQGEDPDTCLKKKGPEGFRKHLESAKDFFDYKLEIALTRHNVKDSLGLMRVTGDFLETLVKVKNPILSSHYLSRLAAALKLDETALRSELAKLKGKTGRPEKTPAASAGRDPGSVPAGAAEDELSLLALMIDDTELRVLGLRELKATDFHDARLGRLFGGLHQLQGDRPQERDWTRALDLIQDENIKQALVHRASFDWPQAERQKAFMDCYQRIKRKQLERKLAELRHSIEQAERAGDKQKAGDFVRKYQSLLKASKTG